MNVIYISISVLLTNFLDLTSKKQTKKVVWIEVRKKWTRYHASATLE